MPRIIPVPAPVATLPQNFRDFDMLHEEHPEYYFDMSRHGATSPHVWKTPRVAVRSDISMPDMYAGFLVGTAHAALSRCSLRSRLDVRYVKSSLDRITYFQYRDFDLYEIASSFVFIGNTLTLTEYDESLGATTTRYIMERGPLGSITELPHVLRSFAGQRKDELFTPIPEKRSALLDACASL